MIMKQNVVLNWSSGKDCALALYEIQQDKSYSVKNIFTTLNALNKRISMHGISVELLKRQAKAIGIPLEVLFIEENISMENYAKEISLKMQEFKKQGILTSAFGDILLEDLKEYREKQLASIGMDSIFPLWKVNTSELIKRFVRLGFKAIVVAVSSTHLDKCFLGTEIDEKFLEKLPPGVNPCGEYGEFHTFCYDGPIFNEKLNFKVGKTKSSIYSNPNGEGEVTFHFLELL